MTTPTVNIGADRTLERDALVVAALAALVGAAIRILEVAQAHAFGFDDSLLVINIVTRSLPQLARPLSFEQTAPILFLWLDRLVVDLVGINAVSLRILPLIAGVLVAPLTWVVAHRLVPYPAAALAVALLAVSPLAVDYSSSTKPYIVDAALAMTLIAVSLRTIRHAEQCLAWRLLCGAGSIGILLSTPAVFTLAACALAIPLALPKAQRQACAPALLVTLTVWSVVAAINYVLLQRAVLDEPYLRRFWGNSFFVPTAPNLAERVRVVASSYSQNLFFGTNWRSPIVARVLIAIVTGIGAIRVGRRTGAWALILLIGPLTLAAIASAVRVYPPSDRTWLFAAPGTAVLATTGLWALAERLPRTVRYAAFVLTGMLLVYLPARQSRLALIASLEPDNLSRALAVWRSETGAGEPIYVFSSDAVRWTYYTTDWRHPDTLRVHSLLALARAIGPNSGNSPPRGHAVRNEGDDLVYSGSGRAELIGISTGMEGGLLNNRQPAPDTGWADNEARRIAAAASADGGSAWILAIHSEPETDSAVVVAAVRRGAHLARDLWFDGVHLYRVQVADR